MADEKQADAAAEQSAKSTNAKAAPKLTVSTTTAVGDASVAALRARDNVSHAVLNAVHQALSHLSAQINQALPLVDGEVAALLKKLKASL